MSNEIEEYYVEPRINVYDLFQPWYYLWNSLPADNYFYSKQSHSTFRNGRWYTKVVENKNGVIREFDG
jgi:hypothetical protein